MGRSASAQRVFLDRRTIDAFTAYMANRTDAGFGRILATPGGELAYAHYKWASVTPQESIEVFWKEVLGSVKWSSRLATTIEDNISHLKARRKAWIEAVLQYLPRGHALNSKVHLVGGYDNVVYGENVAVNLADERFVDDYREATYYLIHELAHAGYFRYRAMPDLAGIKTLHELAETVKLLTHLEGMGVLSSFKLRMKEGGLADSDYKVLLDRGQRKARVREYFELLRDLENVPDRKIRESDYKILGDFSRRPKRLWYITGCHMAMMIEERYGIRELQDEVKKGHRAFFDAYARVEDPLQL